jgi:hypothetical protein
MDSDERSKSLQYGVARTLYLFSSPEELSDKRIKWWGPAAWFHIMHAIRNVAESGKLYPQRDVTNLRNAFLRDVIEELNRNHTKHFRVIAPTTMVLPEIPLDTTTSLQQRHLDMQQRNHIKKIAERCFEMAENREETPSKRLIFYLNAIHYLERIEDTAMIDEVWMAYDSFKETIIRKQRVKSKSDIIVFSAKEIAEDKDKFINLLPAVDSHKTVIVIAFNREEYESVGEFSDFCHIRVRSGYDLLKISGIVQQAVNLESTAISALEEMFKDPGARGGITLKSIEQLLEAYLLQPQIKKLAELLSKDILSGALDFINPHMAETSSHL